MDDRIPLRLIGITYNQVESGVYALILQEEEGERRLPIIIGYPEAQAIECKLQDVKTPRPLTHDLFLSSMSKFDVELLEVRINRLPSGIFSADMVWQGPRGRIEEVDARSSDAIALAIRANAPIFTTSQVLAEAGFTPGDKEKKRDRDMSGKGNSVAKPKGGSSYASQSDEALARALAKAVEMEDYERAGEIKKELDKRNGSQQ